MAQKPRDPLEKETAAGLISLHSSWAGEGCHYRNHLRAQSCEFVNLSAGPGVVSDQTIDARS